MAYKNRPVHHKRWLRGKLHIMVFRLHKCYHFMCMLHRRSWKCVNCREGFFDQVQLFGEYSSLQQHVPVLSNLQDKKNNILYLYLSQQAHRWSLFFILILYFCILSWLYVKGKLINTFKKTVALFNRISTILQAHLLSSSHTFFSYWNATTFA